MVGKNGHLGINHDHESAETPCVFRRLPSWYARMASTETDISNSTFRLPMGRHSFRSAATQEEEEEEAEEEGE
ncbi:unnamed protein product [Taenia asiatica]|uniref:Uncharacterized protein n=1 Tax=Taenia asiatica TaxID=60517 RepID=A0A158R6Z3_TAEAS|nr:unnamed protein product [Taenia asiatica]